MTETILDRLDIVVRMLDACSALSTAAHHPVLLPDTHHYDKPKGNQRFVRVYRQTWSKPYYCDDCNESLRAKNFDFYLEDGKPFVCEHDKPAKPGQRFVDFFVERDTELVWKAAGWKAPTLNFSRGSIATAEDRIALTYGKMGDNAHFYSGF